MADPFASGNWYVAEGKEQDFVDRWTEFLGWTRESQPELVEASLIRDITNGRHFVSFAQWKSAPARDAWKSSPDFMKHFSACRELCDDFQGGDYESLVRI